MRQDGPDVAPSRLDAVENPRHESQLIPADVEHHIFADGIGGGLNYRIIKPIAWRFQLDYLQTRFFSATQSNVRFSTGIVVRF